MTAAPRTAGCVGLPWLSHSSNSSAACTTTTTAATTTTTNNSSRLRSRSNSGSSSNVFATNNETVVAAAGPSNASTERRAAAAVAAAARRKRRRVRRAAAQKQWKRARLARECERKKQAEQNNKSSDDETKFTSNNQMSSQHIEKPTPDSTPQPLANGDKAKLIPPTVAGLSQVVKDFWNNKKASLVAIPTECTYEIAGPLSLWSSNDSPPHLYVTNLESHSLLQKWFVPRRYAFRKPAAAEAGAAAAVENRPLQSPLKSSSIISKVASTPSRLSKNQSILSSPIIASPLSACAVSSTVVRISETRTVLQRLANKLWPGPVIMHVALPQQMVHAITNDEELSGLLIPKPSSAGGHEEDDYYVALRSPCHPLAVKALQQHTQSSLLAGRALSTATGFATCANWAANAGGGAAAAVLNGEERCEIFHVPTCEHEKPFPVSIWINEGKRQIKIVRESSSLEHTTPAILKRVLLQKKQQGGTVERVTQAIMCKWTVREEVQGAGGEEAAAAIVSDE